MSKKNVRVVGQHGQSSRHPVTVNISGILNNAMKAVNDAQIAVAEIQNIAHFESAPPYVPPDTPTIDPRTGQPKSHSMSAGASGGSVTFKRTVHDRSAMRMKDGTLINIVNCQNIQIGSNNRMFVMARQQQQVVETDSEESEVEDPEEDCRQRGLADEETAEILRDSHRQVSDAELQRLSRHIGGAWRRLIRLLGIDDSEVDYIFHTHQSDGLEEVIYQLLKRWKQEKGNPTVSELICALERADMTRLLRHLKP